MSCDLLAALSTCTEPSHVTAGGVYGHGEVIGPRVVRWYKVAALVRAGS